MAQYRRPLRVLGLASVARLGVAELLLDDSKGVLDLGTRASLQLIDLVDDRT